EVALPFSSALGPSEEHVAGGLHDPVAVHDALAVVGKHARACVGFQHRGAGLFDLKEEGILLAGHEEEYPARGSNAADPNHLDSRVQQFITVQKGLEG